MDIKKDKMKEYRGTCEAAQIRVDIANDVLARLEAEQYVAQKGSWFSFRDHGLYEGCDIFHTNPDIKCAVCGVGAIFLSTIRKTNAAINPDLSNPHSNDSLTKFFSPEQIRLIEIAFEEGKGWYSVKTEQEMYARAFGEKFDYPADRIKAIMQNIIEHNGCFIPPVGKRRIFARFLGLLGDY